MAEKKAKRPEFEPDRGWLNAFASVAENVAALLRSLSDLIGRFQELEPTERKAAGRGAIGVGGAAGATAAGYLQVPGAPFWAYVLAGLIFQAPWIVGALPAVRHDSARQKAIYDGNKHERVLREHFKKTRDWRHAWASALVGPLKTPLECCALVGVAMEDAVRKVDELTGYPMALVLVRRQGPNYSVVLTKGEVSDCLKTGTSWPDSDMNVYEYVDRRSFYPNHLVEREVLGGSEYFLIAAAEIDVIGKVKESVLDCFVDVVHHGIGRVVAHESAETGVDR
jgi:hypothetical protein